MACLEFPRLHKTSYKTLQPCSLPHFFHAAMPTCAMHPQPSQFDSSQPLSQGNAMSQPDSQECSFGGGAPLRVASFGAGAAAPSGSRAGSQPSRASAPHTDDELHNVSERQEMDDEGDAEAEAQDSQALLEVRAPASSRLCAPPRLKPRARAASLRRTRSP